MRGPDVNRTQTLLTHGRMLKLEVLSRTVYRIMRIGSLVRQESSARCAHCVNSPGISLQLTHSHDLQGHAVGQYGTRGWARTSIERFVGPLANFSLHACIIIAAEPLIALSV